MKKIALLLLLAICISVLGITVSSAETAATDPALEIAFYTVPMRASVSILYAVEKYNDRTVYVVADGKQAKFRGELTQNLGGGEKTYLIYECELDAKDMSKEVTAYVVDATDTTKTGTTITYSVNTFLDSYIARYNDDATKTAYVDLVKAMKAYGEAIATWRNS